MNRFVLFAAVVLLFIGLAPAPVQAQANIQVGPRLGVPIGDLSNGTSLFLGAEGRVTSPALPVIPNVSFDYYLTDVDNFSLIAVDLNVLYEFGVNNQAFVPYAGGGLGILRSSSEATNPLTGETQSVSNSDVGLNLVGGARFSAGSVDPFVQLNATLGGEGERIGLAGGLLFSF